MKVTFAHVCDYATISREGKLSVLGIFGRISANKVPAQHPQLWLAFEIEVMKHELGQVGKLEVRLAGEDGEILVRLNGEVKIESADLLPGRPVKVPYIIQVNGMRLAKYGSYGFDIFLDGQHTQNVSFEAVPFPPGNIPNS